MLHTSRILRTGKEARQAAAEATVQEPASHAMAEGQLAMAGAGDGDERRRKRVGLEFSSLFSLVVLSWEKESTHL